MEYLFYEEKRYLILDSTFLYVFIPGIIELIDVRMFHITD